MAYEPKDEMQRAIRLWSGVACPNAAGSRALDDLPALIAELAALRGQMVFEDEPATFEAALRAEKEQGA